MEPHVNTFNVEAMLAIGQDPTRIVFFEFRQADRTLNRVRVGFRGVNEQRQRFQHLLIEAPGRNISGSRSVWVGWVNIEYKLSGATVARAASVVAAASTEEVPAGVEVEADD